MKSIIQTKKECFLCGKRYGLENHHIFFGPDRKNSDKYGLVVWLCGETCHRNGPYAVHRNKDVNLKIKQIGQKAFEEKYGDRDEFRRIFRKSYL